MRNECANAFTLASSSAFAGTAQPPIRAMTYGDGHRLQDGCPRVLSIAPAGLIDYPWNVAQGRRAIRANPLRPMSHIGDCGRAGLRRLAFLPRGGSSHPIAARHSTCSGNRV